TVGVGQAEIDIVDHADTIILALMPGSGDSIQALKAGVMEIPDIIVVNKADHPMTDTMVREVRSVLALSHEPGSWKVPILRTEAVRGEGVDALAEKIGEHRAFIEEAGTLAERRARNLRSEVVGIATSRMRRRLEAWAAEDAGTAELLERVVRREVDPATAAGQLLERHPDA
ncbi:MAG: methylmalonyl Co-A mutase-associated GTPase MeaB, partial [Actinobacteria bacterium]|nr:methylmalonyl Co-A mutase-associated GTPase MeaB [Actinomycetota bacterium]